MHVCCFWYMCSRFEKLIRACVLCILWYISTLNKTLFIYLFTMTTLDSCIYNKNLKCWSHIWSYRKWLQSDYRVILNSYDKRTCHALAFCADYDIFFYQSVCLEQFACIRLYLFISLWTVIRKKTNIIAMCDYDIRNRFGIQTNYCHGSRWLT